LHVTVTGHDVALERLPIADWLRLPMSGQGEIAVDVTVPIDHGRRDYRGAKGTIDLRCAKCRIGDDHAKLEIGHSLPAIDVGHLDLDAVEIHASIANGQLNVSRWSVRAPGVEVAVTGRIELAAALDDSVLAGCVRIKAPEFDAGGKDLAAMLLGPIASDGMHNLRIAGHLGEMRRLEQVCDGSVPIQPDIEPAHDAPPHVGDATPDLDAQLSRGIREVKENTYEVDKDVVEQILSNPMAVAKGARVVPTVKNGKAGGFRFYAIRPSSVFAHLGFQNGDTLLTANGFDLTTADEALEIYTKLRDATQIEIGIERRHKSLTLTYVIR